ncbi:MAG: redoxin domain-containing protein [Gemmatimonadota bacterium]|nr:redoxin domain-containing protein [Gemmatimonadota bacterium]
MSARRQWILVGIVVATIAGALAVATSMSSGPKVIGPGAPAPDFVATVVPDSGAEAKPTGIAAYRGRPVLLNIWATWCAPCREEMPRIERIYQELGPQGLAVVAVSIDNPGMTDAIREFRKEMGLTFDVLHDESGRIRDDYQTTGVPETFLIDRTGVVRRRLIGASWTVDEQRPLLRELIAEPAR